MIHVNDPQLTKLVAAWGKLERARYAHSGIMDTHKSTHAIQGVKYIRLDIASSGAFMLQRSTGDVFCVKGYGKVDKRKRVGNLSTLTAAKLYANRWWDLSERKQPLEAA